MSTRVVIIAVAGGDASGVILRGCRVRFVGLIVHLGNNRLRDRRPRQSSKPGIHLKAVLVLKPQPASNRLAPRLLPSATFSATPWGRISHRRRILKQRPRRCLLAENPVLPLEPRLDAEEVHEEVHLAAPLARAPAGAVVAGLAVALALEELGREPV